MNRLIGLLLIISIPVPHVPLSSYFVLFVCKFVEMLFILLPIAVFG